MVTPNSSSRESKQQEATAEAVQTQLPPRLVAEKILFTWKAAERPFKKREKSFWLRVFTISVLFGTILYIAEGVMPVVLLIAILFLFYILSTVPPHTIEYAVTNKGIKIAQSLNEWPNLLRFWFSQRMGYDLLVFDTTMLPGRLELIIESKDKEKLKQVISKYIVEEQQPATNLDKASDWVSEKILKFEKPS